MTYVPALLLGLGAFVALILAFVVGVALGVPEGGFALAAMAVAAGIASWWMARQGAESQAVTAAFEARLNAVPDEPWTSRDDWATGRHVGTVNRIGTALAVGAIVITAAYVATTLYVVLFHLDPSQRDLEALMPALTPLIAFAVMYRPIKRWLLAHRAGPATAVLDRVPARLGGRLEGRLLTGLEAVPEGGVRVRLACVERKRAKNIDTKDTSRSYREAVLWETEQPAQARLERAETGDRPQQVVVPFAFRLPPSEPGVEPTTLLPASRETHALRRVLWRLEALAEVGGVEVPSAVEVPVFEATLEGASEAPRRVEVAASRT